MVLHHILDIDLIVDKLGKMLNPKGYLAIADLYTEDGSFHGEGFTGHNGFDPNLLSSALKKVGFKNISHQECFIINRESQNGTKSRYPVFLLTAQI